MAEVSTAAAPEGVLHRRIEFHLARRTHTAVAVGGGGFRMETLNPDAAGAAGAAATRSGEGKAKRSEKGDAGGMDPELSVARIYLGRIGAGLRNLGNTCYLNSVLQCLTYTEPFAAYLQSGKHSSSCRTSGFCALCALQNHVKTALQSSGKIVSPLQIVKNLRCISRSFRNSRQEDAHELMVNLLESMHKCCLPSGVPSESQSAYDKSLVHKIFGGRLRSQVKCTRCSHCSNKFDPFLDLSLDIAKATTLVRALHNFTEEELLDGGEKQYQCERCRQKVVAKKSFRIDKAPNVLTIHLKRFSPFNPRQKIDKKVEFQPVLDLKPFVSDSKGADLKYSLYGVLVHVGWNTQTGHYYCFVRTSSGMWHNLDDNQVRQVREADVLKQKAYMLFYVRDSVGMPRRDNITANGTVKKAPEKVPCLNGATGSERKIQTMSNSSILAKSSIDCSKYDAKMESSQNNGLPSVEKALAPQNDSATLPTKSIQSAATGLGPSSSDQPLLLLSCSGKQSITDSSSRELLPSADKVTSVASPVEAVVNGAAELSESDKRTYVPKTFPSGKQSITDSSSRELPPNTDKVISVASPVVNGAAELSQSDKGTFIPQTVPFSKPYVYGNDIEIESTTQTHRNGIETGSSTQNHGNGIETGSTTQNHGNGIETGSATQVSVKGAIVSDGCLTSCEHLQESPGQANLTAMELVTGKNESAPELSQVDSGKQICSGGSVQVVMSSSCGGSIAEKVNHKPKKFVRYPVVNMCLGPRQLLVASLKLGKKTKHKKTRRRSVVCMAMPNSPCLADSVNEQLTSTSAAVPSETVERTSRRHKHANAVPGHKDSRPSKKRQKVAEACSGADTSAATDRSDPLKLDPSSPMDQTQTTKNVEPKLGGSRTVSVRARDLLEATVPCWDDIDASSTKTARTLDSKRSIGYVLDEWDEEYDRGKTKKVRRSKDDFDGSNPFQEEANYLSKKQMKQQNYQGKSWKKRDRVHESRV